MLTHADRSLTLSQQTATWAVLGLVSGTLALVTVAAAILPSAVDWQGTFAPSSQALVRGQSPYGHGFGFYNPPWALVPLLPFAADVVMGRAALFVLALVVISLVVVQLGGSPVSLGVILISPPVVHMLLNGNLEWLVLAGLLLPPRWGLFFVLIKPQVGAGVAVWWIAEAWREAGWRGVIILAWPVSLAFLGSLALFGLWPLRAHATTALWWNASFWPWTVPIGLALLAWGVWKRDLLPALAAAPFLSPYVLFHAWSGALVALVRRPAVLAIVVSMLWVLVLRGL
jgi:hypothetical protein